MGLVEMYRETGKQKYLDCAKLIVDSRGSTAKEGGIFSKGPGIIGTDLIQDRVPLRKSKEVVGHNVFFTYLFAGATNVYMEIGDETLSCSYSPGWTNNSSVKVNGKEVKETPKAGTYLSKNRKWEKGDVIELNLPMPVRLMEAHPKAEQLRNQVAVMRGPVLYCLEWKDLPEDKNINNVRIPSDIVLKATKSDFLFRIKKLEGNAFYYDEKPWEGDLYRPLETENDLEEIPINMIPYFAWNNRGVSAMSVWLPLDVK